MNTEVCCWSGILELLENLRRFLHLAPHLPEFLVLHVQALWGSGCWRRVLRATLNDGSEVVHVAAIVVMKSTRAPLTDH